MPDLIAAIAAALVLGVAVLTAVFGPRLWIGDL